MIMLKPKILGWIWISLGTPEARLWYCPALTAACRGGGQERAENRAQLDSQVEKLSAFVR